MLSGLDVTWGLSDSSYCGLVPGEVVFGAVASPLVLVLWWNA